MLCILFVFYVSLTTIICRTFSSRQLVQLDVHFNRKFVLITWVTYIRNGHLPISSWDSQVTLILTAITTLLQWMFLVTSLPRLPKMASMSFDASAAKDHQPTAETDPCISANSSHTLHNKLTSEEVNHLCSVMLRAKVLWYKNTGCSIVFYAMYILLHLSVLFCWTIAVTQSPSLILSCLHLRCDYGCLVIITASCILVSKSDSLKLL